MVKLNHILKVFCQTKTNAFPQTENKDCVLAWINKGEEGWKEEVRSHRNNKKNIIKRTHRLSYTVPVWDHEVQNSMFVETTEEGT